MSPVVGRRRPIGLARGTGAFIAAWLVGVAIARLTGAAAVILLLVAVFVAVAAAAVAGWFRLGRIEVREVTAPALTSVGDRTAVEVQLVTRSSGAPVVVAIGRPGRRDPLARIDAGAGGMVRAELEFDAPGIVDTLDIDVATAGIAGMMWWRRRTTVIVEPILVAPVAGGDLLPVETSSFDVRGDGASVRGLHDGDVDGVRQWREGDADHAVHWPSTMRAGELVVRDRTPTADTRWSVRSPGPADAARLRHTLEEGLHRGHEVVFVEGSPPNEVEHPVRSGDDAARWAATAAGAGAFVDDDTVPWYRRQLRLAHRDEDPTLRPIARWLAAGAAFAGIGMLLGALAAAPTSMAIAAVGVVVAAAISVRSARVQRRPWWLRISVAALALGALVAIAGEAQGVGRIVEALRGPMPDLFMVLVVLHGVEVVDRRTHRVHLAITFVVAAYAAGLRIDERVGWWLAAWGAFAVASTITSAAGPRPSVRTVRSTGGWRRPVRPAIAVAAMVAGCALLLGLIPVPDGPANLALPALADDANPVTSPGALAGPDGTIAGTGDPGDGTRGSIGQVGGYPGFSETLDTSIRGDLGDQIVMRVRAPEPAFWRGQTFTDFDGRFWRVSPQTGQPRRGPDIRLEPTIGDEGRGPTTEFVQTFFVEVDLPNVVFAAARPERLAFDGTVYARPDGAIRAGATLTEGSVYSVVSDRPIVTGESLRAQGDLAEWFAQFDDERSKDLLAPYLALPASTTDRTIELATELRRDTTYDTILSYQAWLAANTEYDLRAPVPAPGVDAVDDYLFASRRGFCEQIASSLVVMLRSQGVPARLATGYLPGERDRVSGVWKVRASDAHAWVEVWFPESGWEAFDPTAEVPLSGEVAPATIGGDLVDAAISSVTGHPVEIGLAALTVGAALGVVRLVRRAAHRRKRGRWGLLQDRFHAVDRDVDDGRAERPATNPEIARRVGTADPDEPAGRVASTLDRAMFDPAWIDDDDIYAAARADVELLERRDRVSERVAP